MATSRLKDVEKLASASAWDGLERYMGIVLRRNLGEAIDRLADAIRNLQTVGTRAEENLGRAERSGAEHDHCGARNRLRRYE